MFTQFSSIIAGIAIVLLTLTAYAQSAEIMQVDMSGLSPDPGTIKPVTVLEDRKYVICNECPHITSSLIPVVVPKPVRIAMRFSKPPFKTPEPKPQERETKVSPPRKENIEVSLYFPFKKSRPEGGDIHKLLDLKDALLASDRITVDGYACGLKGTGQLYNASTKAKSIGTLIRKMGIPMENLSVSGVMKDCSRFEQLKPRKGLILVVKTINKE